MSYCNVHQIFFTHNCPRCVSGPGVPAGKRATGYRSTDSTTRERALRLLEERIAAINTAHHSFHAVRCENNELVLLYAATRHQVSFMHAPFSAELWGGIVSVLDRAASSDSQRQIQAVMETMRAWGGKHYAFPLS